MLTQAKILCRTPHPKSKCTLVCCFEVWLQRGPKISTCDFSPPALPVVIIALERLNHGLPRRDSTCAHFTWRPLLYSLAGSSAGAFLTGHYTGQRSLLVLCTLQQFPPREYTGSWLPSFPNLVQPSLRTNGAAPQDPTLTTRYFKMHCETVNKFQVIGCGSLDMPKNAVCVLWLTLSRYWHCW